MSHYVDGFIITIPKKNHERYKKMATVGKKIWMKHGALDYKECVLEDAKPKGITLTFNKLTQVKPSEEVWFSFIIFKSRKHRDEVNAKVMQDPAMKPEQWEGKMPFDMKRFSYGGFNVIV
jgi:uncharacterized protein YbaA (DUF1428 family)